MTRWTDSDNLRGREATVIGGPANGLRIVVRQRDTQIRYAQIRYPDVFDLSDYDFDAQSWTFRYREKP